MPTIAGKYHSHEHRVAIQPVNDMSGLTLLRVDAKTGQVIHYERHPMNTYVISYATDSTYVISRDGAKRGRNKAQCLVSLREKNEQRLIEAGKTLKSHQDIHAHLRRDILRVYKNGL